MLSNPINRRKNVRADIQVPVVLAGKDKQGRPFQTGGMSIDFSRNGLGLVLDQNVAVPGSVVTVSSAGKFQSDATIQWTARDRGTGRCRVGLRLVHPNLNFGFKIAASCILFFAFLSQTSMAGSNRASGAARTQAPATSREHNSTVASLPEIRTERAAAGFGSTPVSSSNEESSEAAADTRSWIEQAIASASVERSTRGRSRIQIQMSKDIYVPGETITAGAYRLTNPSISSQKVELKTWLAAPGLAPISVGNVGSDGLYALPAGLDEEYGPVRLLPVASDMPAGRYEFNARMLDPVTGDIVAENINPFSVSINRTETDAVRKEEPINLSIDCQVRNSSFASGETVSLAEFRLTNKSTSPAAVELKIWLEVPGLEPLPVFTMGADGSLVLTPGSDFRLEPLSPFKVTGAVPRGTYRLTSRIVDPATGTHMHESSSHFEIQ